MQLAFNSTRPTRPAERDPPVISSSRLLHLTTPIAAQVSWQARPERPPRTAHPRLQRIHSSAAAMPAAVQAIRHHDHGTAVAAETACPARPCALKLRLRGSVPDGGAVGCCSDSGIALEPLGANAGQARSTLTIKCHLPPPGAV